MSSLHSAATASTPLLPKSTSATPPVRRRTVVSNVENPPKNRFTQGDFTRFSMQVSENSHNFRFRLPVLHIQNLSNHCRHKYDPSISQFFEILFLAGFCNLEPLCAKFKTGQGQGRRCNFSSRSTAAYVLYSRYTVLRKFSYPTICDFRFHTLQFVIYSKAWIYTASSCTDLAGARF